MAEPADLAPFEEVYSEFASRVFRFCLAMVHDEAVAEDVTAEVFVAAFRTYEKTQPGRSQLRPWLFRIARNKAIDHLRQQKRLLGLLPRLHSTDDVRDTGAVAEQNEELRQLLAGFADLNNRERQLIGLRHAGLSFNEIGALVGLQEKHAVTAYHRAISHLRKLVEGDG